MPQIILNEPRIRALVGEGEATRVTQHVRVRLHGQTCALAIGAEHHPGSLLAERAMPLTNNSKTTPSASNTLKIRAEEMM
jgi:hypothetical protein